MLPARQYKIDELADDLRFHGFGGLFFAKGFSLLVYPTGTEEWSFLDRQFIQETESPISLRFVMFVPKPEFLSLGTSEILSEDSPLKLSNDEPTINRVFREAYQIEYKTFALGEKKGSEAREDAFFIMYPPFKKDEHDLLVTFLEANNATVYSSYTPGAWDYVLREVHNAVILASMVQTFVFQVLTMA